MSSHGPHRTGRTFGAGSEGRPVQNPQIAEFHKHWRFRRLCSCGAGGAEGSQPIGPQILAGENRRAPKSSGIGVFASFLAGRLVLFVLSQLGQTGLMDWGPHQRPRRKRLRKHRTVVGRPIRARPRLGASWSRAATRSSAGSANHCRTPSFVWPGPGIISERPPPALRTCGASWAPSPIDFCRAPV